MQELSKSFASTKNRHFSRVLINVANYPAKICSKPNVNAKFFDLHPH